MGALMTVVAAYGYKVVARIANIAAPWMVLVFIAYGIVAARQLGIDSVGEFWPKAQELIWTGGAPLAGRAKFTFWHVMFFAWFCNMAVHIGMADLSVFRYARKSWYAVGTAAGMYLGHFIAWLSASILYAQQLRATPGNTDVLPGPLAYNAAGIAGVICVIVAGWTTANPTIYRAGLAFQAISPASSRYRVTLVTGALATDRRVVPGHRDEAARFRRALRPGADADGRGDLRGLLAGRAVRFPAELRGGAAASRSTGRRPSRGWRRSPLCLAVVNMGGMQIYFVGLPGWFAAALLYVVLSRLMQRKEARPMKRAAQLVSLAALVGTILPPVLFFSGQMALDAMKAWMLVATVAWFAATPLWMDR